MSESIYTDPAAPERGGVRFSDAPATPVTSPGAGGAGTPAGDVAPDDFLFAQRDVIRSTPVLAAAATAMIKSDAHVREALDVAVAKGEGVLTIAYSAATPDEAALG